MILQHTGFSQQLADSVDHIDLLVAFRYRKVDITVRVRVRVAKRWDPGIQDPPPLTDPKQICSFGISGASEWLTFNKSCVWPNATPEEKQEVFQSLVHQGGVSPQSQKVPGAQVGCRGRPGAGAGVTWVCWR